MKHLYLTFLILFSLSATFAQCPVGNIQLLTQSDVDNFTTRSPNCTALTGSLLVGDENNNYGIGNLTGLQHITSIGGSLAIRNTSISSLDPLQNLTAINSSLVLVSNEQLTSLSGLDNLVVLGGIETIFTPFTSFAPLSKITSMGEINLSWSAIENFEGMENLRELTLLRVTMNENLTSLKGLENIAPQTSLRSNISITMNSNLSFCLVPFVCKRAQDLPGSIGSEIHSNRGTCSESAIDAACEEVGLPVTLADFTARLNDVSLVSLTWTTSSETNSKHFEVQRSADGNFWETIGRVLAQGESDGSNIYTYSDQSTRNGGVLYRLKMVDMDDTYAYSKILNVNFQTRSLTGIYPNPASDKILLGADNLVGLEKVSIRNQSGKLVLQTINAEEGITVKQLPKGFYILTITKQSGESVNHKMFKE